MKSLLKYLIKYSTIVFVILLALPLWLFADNEEYTKLETLYNDFLIMPETLVYMIQRGDTNYILLDLRDGRSYSASHIVGAVSFPWSRWEQLDFSNGLSEIPRDKQIFLISSDGFYSLKALEILLHHGYKTVYSIEGGMDNWPYGDYLEKN